MRCDTANSVSGQHMVTRSLLLQFTAMTATCCKPTFRTHDRTKIPNVFPLVADYQHSLFLLRLVSLPVRLPF